MAANGGDWLQPLATVLGTAATATVAIYALRRQERSTRRQWLQEQRQDAYVNFLNETRRSYEAISRPVWDASAASSLSGAGRAEWFDWRAYVIPPLNRAYHATAMVRIVGPQEMAIQAEAVMARLELDSYFYAPNRDVELPTLKTRILQLAKKTGTPGLFEELQASLDSGVDIPAYVAAHDKHRLNDAWDRFTVKAREVLAT
jgi:hypothetical protein